jgi:hypothetical protein
MYGKSKAAGSEQNACNPAEKLSTLGPDRGAVKIETKRTFRQTHDLSVRRWPRGNDVIQRLVQLVQFLLTLLADLLRLCSPNLGGTGGFRRKIELAGVGDQCL